jgi:aryl-alcohol dehydrogenase-like predicted oxidoreductase
MQQRQIGDASVGAIGLGGASLSFADGRDDERSVETILAAIDAGMTYLDTAAVYTTADELGHNERLIARAVARAGRDDLLVGTKGGHYRIGADWPIDGRPESIRRDCEGSLAALGVDVLDLYYLHWPDPEVPFADSVGTLEELRREGKVRRTGVSNVNAQQLAVALGASAISAVQNTFSPFQTRDRDLIAECARHGVAYTSYSPLGGGRQTHRRADLPLAAARADELGVSLERVILAWELALSPNLIVISGSTRLATVRDSAAAADLALDPETVAAVESDVASLQERAA